METVDIKTIVYLVIALIWFLYSSFSKSQKEARKKTAQPPPLSEDEIKEIFQKPEKRKAPVEVQQMPSFQVAGEKKEKKKVAKIPTTISTSFSETENQNEKEFARHPLLDGVDPRQMILYSEILKRPKY